MEELLFLKRSDVNVTGRRSSFFSSAKSREVTRKERMRCLYFLMPLRLTVMTTCNEHIFAEISR